MINLVSLGLTLTSGGIHFRDSCEFICALTELRLAVVILDVIVYISRTPDNIPEFWILAIDSHYIVSLPFI